MFSLFSLLPKKAPKLCFIEKRITARFYTQKLLRVKRSKIERREDFLSTRSKRENESSRRRENTNTPTPTLFFLKIKIRDWRISFGFGICVFKNGVIHTSLSLFSVGLGLLWERERETSQHKERRPHRQHHHQLFVHQHQHQKPTKRITNLLKELLV